MFYLKHKNEEFAAFKAYKAWAERQLGTTLKCRWFNQGGEFLSNEQKTYMAENRIEYQMSMPNSPQQNGWAERFQQTIVNGAEAMWHHAGLSNSFWIYAVKAKLHTYNVTLIKQADYQTPKELWSGKKNKHLTPVSSVALAWLGQFSVKCKSLMITCSKCLGSNYDPSACGVMNIHKLFQEFINFIGVTRLDYLRWLRLA